MINYTSQNQLSLERFIHPFERDLNTENKRIKLAKVVPWDKLAVVYSKKLQTSTGRMSVNIRTVLAALIVKHRLRLDDRGTVKMIPENIYIQYFCSFKSFTTKKAFDPSLFVDIRKRLGVEKFDKFNQLVIEKAEELKPRKARKESLNIAKKGRKNNKVLRKGIKAQLQFVTRDIRILKQLTEQSDRADKLSRRDRELLETITKVYTQQKWMYDNRKHSVHDCIVNIFQPWVRPIIRGKDKNKTEFGSKINISEVNGFCRIDRFSWDAYNEGGDLEQQVENFRNVYDCYPKVLQRILQNAA